MSLAPAAICPPPTTCALVNSSVPEANRSSPQCLDCLWVFLWFFILKSCIKLTKVLPWESTCTGGGGQKQIEMLLVAPGYVIPAWPCQVLTLQVQLDDWNAGILLATGRKHGESALKCIGQPHQSSDARNRQSAHITQRETKKRLCVFMDSLSGINNSQY